MLIMEIGSISIKLSEYRVLCVHAVEQVPWHWIFVPWAAETYEIYVVLVMLGGKNHRTQDGGLCIYDLQNEVCGW